jgi:hypothetical protein
MCKYLFFMPVVVMLCLQSLSQDSLPINPATKLVSINDVITIEGKTVSQLKATAQSFIATYSNQQALLEQKQTFRKDKQLPAFSANETLNQDSAVSYYCQMKVFIGHGSLGIKSESDFDIINFKINFYFKTGKVKYDITSFSHTYLGFRANQNGGKFENGEGSDFKTVGGKKKWMQIRQKSLEQARQIATVIEETYKTGNDKQLDF